MASIISTSNKEKMLTGIREESQGFRKILDLSHDELVKVAEQARYVGTTVIVNRASALMIGISESMEAFDNLLNDIAEVYLKQGVMSEEFEAALKKFMSEKLNLVADYTPLDNPTGDENYKSEDHGVRIVDAISNISKKRLDYIETVSQFYKSGAGEDIADMIVPALKKIEDSCNELITELKDTIDKQASIDSRLSSVQNGIGQLASSLKMNSVAEKKREFGTVPSSNYLGDL